VDNGIKRKGVRDTEKNAQINKNRISIVASLPNNILRNINI
jgi:hypothetical protein